MTPLTQPIGKCFGPGEPGWLKRDVPGGTVFDLGAGTCFGPVGSLVRSNASGLWMSVAVDARFASDTGVA